VNSAPALRRRKRTAPLPCEDPVDLVSDILHYNERTHEFGPCTGSHARLSHRPAVRRLYLEGAHEPMTITQHPLPHPLVGPSTVVIEVIRRPCAVSSATGKRDGVGNFKDTPMNWPLNNELIRGAWLWPSVGSGSGHDVLCYDRDREWHQRSSVKSFPMGGSSNTAALTLSV